MYRKDYGSVRNYLILFSCLCAFLFVAFTVLLVVTFKFLEIKALSLIPLVSLICLTICAGLFAIQIIRLNVIDKLISGEYEISQDLLKLIIFKLKNTKDDFGGPDLFGEIGTCCTDCTKNCSMTEAERQERDRNRNHIA